MFIIYYHWSLPILTANITNLTHSNIPLNQTSPHFTSELLFYLINVDTTLMRGCNYLEHSPRLSTSLVCLLRYRK